MSKKVSERDDFECMMNKLFPHISLDGVEGFNGFIYRSQVATGYQIVWRAAMSRHQSLLKQVRENLERINEGDYRYLAGADIQDDVEKTLAAINEATGEK